MTGEDHKQWYEEEATRRSRRPHASDSPRGRLRAEFAAFVHDEGRKSIVDFGCGPGIDAPEFVARGLDYVGLDLAFGNAKLAAESGLTVIPGSLMEPPLRSRSFDSGWSMSVLMHLPTSDVAAAVRQMSAVLKAGAPLTIGTWGSVDECHIVDDDDVPGQRRHFYLRSLATNVELLGPVEFAQCLQLGPPDWDYHVLRLRAS